MLVDKRKHKRTSINKHASEAIFVISLPLGQKIVSMAVYIFKAGRVSFRKGMMGFGKDSAYGVRLCRYKTRVLIYADVKLTACPGPLQLMIFPLSRNHIGK